MLGGGIEIVSRIGACIRLRPEVPVKGFLGDWLKIVDLVLLIANHLEFTPNLYCTRL